MQALLLTLALSPALAQDAGLFDLGPELPVNSSPFDRFGWAVDSDGGRAVVGSTDLSDGVTPIGKGGAWLLERDPKGGWTVVEELDPLEDVTDSGFGYSVAIDGDRIAVGAPLDDGGSPNGGAVYVFERLPAGKWGLEAKLTADDLPPAAELGRAVDVDGDRVLAGAPRPQHPTISLGRGAAYLFEPQGSVWVQTEKFIQVDEGPGTVPQISLGASVAIDGDVVVLGAPTFFSGLEAGSALAFLDGPQGWSPSSVLVPAAAGNFDEVGASVATDGKRLFLGAPLHDGAAPNGGAVWIFRAAGSSGWVEDQILTSPAPTDFARFGRSIDFDDQVLAVGEPLATGGGGAHLFDVSAPVPKPLSFLQSHSAAPGDEAGQAVAVDGGFVLVGAPFRDVVGAESGAVQVWFDHDASELTAPSSFGQGTPGCDGTQTLSTNLPALTDTAGFEVLCSNAPPSAAGFLYVADVRDVSGSDPLGFGVQVHLNLSSSSFLLDFPMVSSSSGQGSVNLPLPDAPVLAGLNLHFQALWAWTGCAPSPFDLSTSRGLTVELGL